MFRRDANVEIPMNNIEPRGHTSQSQTTFGDDIRKSEDKRSHISHQRPMGHRKRSESHVGKRGSKSEQSTLTGLGRVYDRIANFSIVTRYLLYVLPVSAILAVPIVVGAAAPSAKDARVGKVRMVWFFVWIEIVWNSLWIAKLLAKALPAIFQFFCGVVSSGTRKYSLIIKALEFPLSLVGWMLCSWATFLPLMQNNPDRIDRDKPEPGWWSKLNQVLAAGLVSTLVFLAEKFIVQLISITYHRKQFNDRIKESKHSVWLLSLLYDASRQMFPAYCSEFADEDYIINDSIALSTTPKSHKRSGSSTPMKLIRDVGRVGDKITAAFGNIAQELTGKEVFNPTSAHSIVVEALEKKRSSEALARRIWMSFVSEGSDELTAEDIREVLGIDRQAEAEECFEMLDKDGNGDISLEEMVMTVVEAGRVRHSIANSMHDVDQAIHVLDNVLSTVVFVIVIFVFVAFLNSSLYTTLGTAGTALLSLSFVFATTAQELLGSCIFLFVKHPYDVGDRVDITNQRLIVEHISLLFTVFKCVDNNKIIQVPNIVLNANWVENVTRSKAMREIIQVCISFETSMEDILLLKELMQDFVREKDNARDFLPDLDVEVTGIAEMNKMELKVEIRHKSNWSNESLRATRRSKFMCALVQALRKVPIYAPGGGDMPLGDATRPSFNVAVTPDEAKARRDKWLEDKAAKRLANEKDKADDTGASTGVSDGAAPLKSSVSLRSAHKAQEEADQQAAAALNSKPVVYDMARDDWEEIREDTNALAKISSQGTHGTHERRRSVEEVRSLLHSESVRGRRRRADSISQLPDVSESDSVIDNYAQMNTSTTASTGFPQRKESLRVTNSGGPGAGTGGPSRYYAPPVIPAENYAAPPSLQSRSAPSQQQQANPYQQQYHQQMQNQTQYMAYSSSPTVAFSPQSQQYEQESMPAHPAAAAISPVSSVGPHASDFPIPGQSGQSPPRRPVPSNQTISGENNNGAPTQRL